MRDETRKVLIAVTHLLGIGHFARMAALGHALLRAGDQVTILSGGRPAASIATGGLDVIQLPAVYCRNGDFSRLLADHGELADDALLQQRARIMVETVRAVKPDILITELYPFGRRSLAQEFEALLAAAHALEVVPTILCSVRDVLNPPSKPSRAEEVIETLGRAYHAVLVHGDPAALPLSASWPVSPALGRSLHYTGYLRDKARGQSSEPGVAAERLGILVSAGGSDVGMALNRAALQAAEAFPDYPWRVLVSAAIDDKGLTDLHEAAPTHVRIERARPDFPHLLAQSALSISQAGYNTVLDLAAAGTRAILVPYAAGNEQEQTIRASSLAKQGLARLLPECKLSAERLAHEVRASLAQPLPDWSPIRLDGHTGVLTAIDAVTGDRQETANAWRHCEGLLAHLSDQGEVIDLWLRDDDAVAATAQLDRFLTIARAHNMPVALAVIPDTLTSSLIDLVKATSDLTILVHGHAHRNHAQAGERASEFPDHRPEEQTAFELSNSFNRVMAAFGDRALPVMVPPWNRISARAIAKLPDHGYQALSVFGREQAVQAPDGLLIMNTHWDPINWRGHRGLRNEAMLLRELTSWVEERMAYPAQRRPPIGLLTHHLVHDPWISHFLARMLSRLASFPAIRFISAREAFAWHKDLGKPKPAGRQSLDLPVKS
ncbi:COG4671 Predicted glycosyl transferase [Rhabdaerophilaceae bacterium]